MIRIKYINDERVTFTNGSYIMYDHLQDCCEDNFADFQSIRDTVLENMDFKDIVIENSDFGFLLNGHLINCYSNQNGYYTNNIDIYYKDKNDKIIKEINTEGYLL